MGENITTKQLENILEKFNDKNQVILEELRGDIQVVAEGVSIVQKDLNEFKEETRENFEGLRNNLDNFKQKTSDNFKVIFDYQSNFSDSFDDEMILIKKELDEIKKELEKRPTGEAFGVLEKRIFNLENRFNKIEKMKV